MVQHQPSNNRIYNKYFLLSRLPPLPSQLQPVSNGKTSIDSWLHSQSVSLLQGFSHSLLLTWNSHNSIANPFQNAGKESLVSAPVTLIAFTISSFLLKPSLGSPFNSHTTSSAEEPFIFNKASKTHTVRYST